jgi:hypothetical protein
MPRQYKTTNIVSGEDLVAEMLREYREQSAKKDAIYNNFIHCYIDWKAFSIPARKNLESKRPRCNSDKKLSKLYEKGLALQARMAAISKEVDDRERCKMGIQNGIEVESPESEETSISRSTSPETAKTAETAE